MVAETLIGLREGSDNQMSERQPCELAKGECVNERLAISSSQAKGEIESTTLVGEGEGVNGVSQGEPLMQKERENERNAGTGEIRVEEEMEVNEADKEIAYQIEYQAVLDSISLNAETFTHPNAALQTLAAQGNQEAEQTLGLIHTEGSILRAKEAISNLPQGFEHSASEESASEESEDLADIDEPIFPKWLVDKSYVNYDAGLDIARLYSQAVKAQSSTSLSVHELQNQYIGTLKLHKGLINQLAQDKGEVIDSVESTERKLTARIDQLEATMHKVLNNQEAILQGQEKQNRLLESFLQLHSINPADNKKGEKHKEVEGSRQNEPSVEGEKMATSQGEPPLVPVIEDSIAQRLATTSMPLPPIPPTNTVIRQVLVSDLVFSEKPARGEPSHISEFIPTLVWSSTPMKKHDKQVMVPFYPLPKSDKYKILGSSIQQKKTMVGEVEKERRAVIYRGGVEITVPMGFPEFSSAKNEETARLKAEGKYIEPSVTNYSEHPLSEEEIRLALELERELQEEGYGLDEDAQVQPKRKERTKSIGKKRAKARANRPPSPKKVVEKEVTRPSSPPKEVIDKVPDIVNEVKEEPVDIDWDSLVFPKFKILPDSPKRRTRRRPVMPVKLAAVPQIAKGVSKESEMYIATPDYSDTNYFWDRLEEVRGLAASARYPERLEFVYYGGSVITRPLEVFLNESFESLTKVWSKMKRLGGHTPDAKLKVFRKINEIRNSWNSKEGLPRKIILPFTGKRVHFHPFWMIEFKDDQGCRRFFRLEDQLEKSSISFLMSMMSLLNPDDHEEGIVYRTIQRQIQILKEREKGVKRPRKKKGTD